MTIYSPILADHNHPNNERLYIRITEDAGDPEVSEFFSDETLDEMLDCTTLCKTRCHRRLMVENSEFMFTVDPRLSDDTMRQAGELLKVRGHELATYVLFADVSTSNYLALSRIDHLACVRYTTTFIFLLPVLQTLLSTLHDS